MVRRGGYRHPEQHGDQEDLGQADPDGVERPQPERLEFARLGASWEHTWPTGQSELDAHNL
jgi:hypothetical protein